MISLRGMYETQAMLFIIMIVGAILRRKNMITAEGKSTMSDLIIYVTLPCSIVKSFMVEFNMEIFRNSYMVFIVACISVLISHALSLVLYQNMTGQQKKVLQYGTLSSNSGMLGNPIAEGVFGSMGLFYASIYLIPLRAMMWSLGMTYFTECPDRKTLIKKVCTHPCILAVAIGCVIMIGQIPIPGFIDVTLTTLGKANTGLSMLFVGAILGSAQTKNLVTPKMLFYSFVRLILIPGLVYIVCLILHTSQLVTGVSVVLAGMPCAAATVILASKYDGDELFATNCVVFTTILSMITAPMWCMLLI